MHTLYPPLDDVPAPMNDGDDVLPSEIRENFKTMKALVNNSKSTQEEEKEITATTTTTTKDNSSSPDRKRKSRAEDEDDDDDDNEERHELEAKKLQLAIKTAVAVENEMARLRNGIAELEALLEAQEAGGEVLEFPSLAPVVPSDEGGGSVAAGAAADAGEEQEERESPRKNEGEYVYG